MKHKIGAPADIRLDPNLPARIFDDSLADSQTDARPGILVFGVEPLENPKDDFVIFGTNTDPIVSYREEPPVFRRDG
jgi:hypothetical protein